MQKLRLATFLTIVLATAGVGAGPDNFANIPPRYGTPDAEMLNTGDSGARVACGVVR